MSGRRSVVHRRVTVITVCLPVCRCSRLIPPCAVKERNEQVAMSAFSNRGASSAQALTNLLALVRCVHWVVAYVFERRPISRDPDKEVGMTWQAAVSPLSVSAALASRRGPRLGFSFALSPPHLECCAASLLSLLSFSPPLAPHATCR